MFRVSQHPSSGVLKTVSATSGISHGTGTATSFHRGLIPIQLDATVCRHLFTAVTLHVSGVTAPIIRSIKIVSATSGTAISFQRGLVRTGVSESCGIYFFLYFVFSTPDDGCCDTRNM